MGDSGLYRTHSINWGYFIDSYLCFDSFSTDSIYLDFDPWYDIELEEEWNLISLPIVPESNDIEDVLADIIDNVNIVWHYDAQTEGWESFIPDGPPPGLTVMDEGQGYWFYMEDGCTLTVEGDETADFVLELDMDAYEDWNMLGSIYLLGICESDPSGKITEVRGWDAETQQYYEETGALEPGKGYWVYMWDDCDYLVSPNTEPCY